MRETKYDRVHVVTVMHNNAATLRGYLNALAAAPARIATVTLVDNASSDGSASLARALADDLPFPVEVIDNRNTGFAGGYLAARASGAERGLPVLCLNPDVQLTVGAVESLVETMNALPEAAVVTMPLIDGSGEEDSASRRRLPRLGASVVYSVLGRLTPAKLRYNRRAADDAGQLAVLPTGEVVHRLEATTGALMLVDPAFRSLDEGIFDVDYWMYGEDLQLCLQAQRQNKVVAIVEVPPAVHLKGASSGRPRSRRANRAFHEAMYLYARKNLVRSGLASTILRIGVATHFVVSEWAAAPTRAARRPVAPS